MDNNPVCESNIHPQQKGPGRFVFIVIGLLALALGTAGWVVPLVPTTPFYLLTAFCFGKSSRRLHTWFLSTGLYKRHLKSYMERRTMSLYTKIWTITSLTIFMGISFYMMSTVPVGRAVLAVVWVVHVLYFLFRVKTV